VTVFALQWAWTSLLLHSPLQQMVRDVPVVTMSQQRFTVGSRSSIK
jgi:hypothetical protein